MRIRAGWNVGKRPLACENFTGPCENRYLASLRTMVGFVERFRKPKSPIVLGSPQKDGVVQHRAAPSSQNTTLPVLRNFSYPTSITNSARPPPTSGAQREPPSTWDQLGEICNFSPDITSRTRRARTAGLEDPFFYTTDSTPYKQLVDRDERPDGRSEAQQPTGLMPSSQQTARNVEKSGPKDKSTKLPRGSTARGYSIGDHIFSQKSNITARLKRNSVGHHKTSSSFDASRLLTRRPDSLERPMSSSGVPLIDTRLTHSSSSIAKTSVSPLIFPGDTIRDFSTDLKETTILPHTISVSQALKMEPVRSRGSLQGLHGITPSSDDMSGDQRCGGRTSESNKRKGKEGKSRWFSQFKEWVSVSEPSTQALKDYKKDTYKKAGIAPDDPLANAKLHLPVAALPPDAIKPGGRGPDPEELVLQRAMQRKKARESLPGARASQASQASQASRSSTSHRSSSSSATNSALRDGM
ncbi:hypothetical protein HD806DRAFT_548301 [Xylariaceae sp. AK1471]|nr:hypothetical protein HD806DRAFT_548301 [Xylariaceae sp. AK1471]